MQQDIRFQFRERERVSGFLPRFRLLLKVMDFDGGNKRVYNRLGGPSGASAANDAGKHQKVCNFWRSGKCNRFPCPYLHRELPGPGPAAANGSGAPKRFANDRGLSGPAPRRGPNFNSHNTWGRAGANKAVQKMEKVCNYWVQGNCGYGDKCKFLHSWKMGEGFSLLTQLEGHQKVVTGIALPSGSDKLYSGSKDDTVRVWDCASGQVISCVIFYLTSSINYVPLDPAILAF